MPNGGGEDADLVKVLAEVVNGPLMREQVYPDAIAPGAKELGAFLKDAVSALHVLGPFLVLPGLLGRRATRFLRERLDAVPAEHRAPVPPQMAAEVLESVRLRDEADPLRAMFGQLLQTAMDDRTAERAHPAFTRLVGQLSPDEADVLRAIALTGRFRLWTDTGARVRGSEHVRMPEDPFPVPLRAPQHLRMYVDHLTSLGLVEWKPDRDLARSHDMNSPLIVAMQPWWIVPRPFGWLLIRACLPEEQVKAMPFGATHVSVTLQPEDRRPA